MTERKRNALVDEANAIRCRIYGATGADTQSWLKHPEFPRLQDINRILEGR